MRSSPSSCDAVPDPLAVVHLPDPTVAPGYRESLATRSRFAVENFGGGLVGVAPVEGAGATAAHFDLSKVCDSATNLEDPATWEVLRTRPPRQRGDLDPAEYRQAMLDRGAEIRTQNPGIESEIVAFALAAFGAGQAGELDELLKMNLPPLFEQFPEGSLWYVTVGDVLLARLAFARAQLVFQMTPDMPVGEEMDQLKAFSDLSLTKGIDFSAVMKIPLVLLSPAVLGLLIPAMPHIFVFCFGADADLRRPYPTSLASLYRPSVLHDVEGLNRSEFLADPDPADGPRLLEWWVGQLNRLYSHTADPTRFTDDKGNHDAPAQTAWMVTFERLLGDALSLLAEPQTTDLDRVQIAFDLLDKAESLLGYGRDRSGKGFAALLRRRQTLARLGDAFTSLPNDLAARIHAEVERLFDGLYAAVRDNAVGFRLTASGARIAKRSADQLHSVDNDTLVASICRAVRNSSHGLLETLRDHDDRFLLAASTGGVPAELPALAPLIAIGLVADADGLIDGTWSEELTAQPQRRD